MRQIFNYVDLIAVLLHSEVSDRPKGITIHLIMVEGIPSSISSPSGTIKILTVETLLPFNSTQRCRSDQKELPFSLQWLKASQLNCQPVWWYQNVDH